MKACIYTAIFGNYNELQQPVEQDIPCDFICFTDAPWPSRIGAWQIIHVDKNPVQHPRLQAKYFKLMSHEVFLGGRLAYPYDNHGHVLRLLPFDLLIWIDGTIEITSSAFARHMGASLGASGWAMHRHPDRDCIFEEAEASMKLPKYAYLPIGAQVAAYAGQGIKPHSGLYACTLIVRRAPLPPELIEVNRQWWAENLTHSIKDQISLPYVLQKLQASVDVIAGDLYQSTLFRVGMHKMSL